MYQSNTKYFNQFSFTEIHKALSGRLSLLPPQKLTAIGQDCYRPSTRCTPTAHSNLKVIPSSYLDFSDVLPAAPSQLFKLVSDLCTDAESEVGLFEPLAVPI